MPGYCPLQLCRERAAQLEAAAAKEAKPTQSCGKLMDPETEEALYRDYSRKMKEKLGLSDYEYTGKDTAPLQGPTTDLTGRPEGTVPTTAPRMLATAAPPTRKVHSLMSHVTASWWMESPRTRQVSNVSECSTSSSRCFDAVLLLCILTHTRPRDMARSRPPFWNFSFAAWKWVNMDGNWRNFDVNISSYV